MKLKTIGAVILLTWCRYASGQEGFVIHMDTIQTGRNGVGISIREVENGYLLFSGQFSQAMPTRRHVYARRLDGQGNVLSEQEYQQGQDRDFDMGYIDAVAYGPEGGFVAGIKEGYDLDSETWLYSFDQEGDTLDRRFLFGYATEDSILHAIRQTRATSDGGYVLCGFYSHPMPTAYAFLVRVNAEEDTLWTRRYGELGESTVALSVAEYTDGGFLLSGHWDYGAPFDRCFLIRTDANGNQIWRRNFGGIASQNGVVGVAPDGGIITWCCHKLVGMPLDYQEMMLTKWSPGGSVVWQNKVHYNYRTFTHDMEVLPDGSVIAGGAVLNKGVLVRFNADGDTLWSRLHSVFASHHYFYDVEPTSDGGFVCTGVAWSSPLSDPEIETTQVIWVVKTDSLGCVVPGCQFVGVEEIVLDLNEYLAVAPNPVAHGQPLQVTFSPPAAMQPQAPLRLKVLDAAGRLVQEELFAGTTFNLSTHNLSTGSYHLHLCDAQRWLAGKTIVVE